MPRHTGFPDDPIAVVTEGVSVSVPAGQITLVELQEVAPGHSPDEMVDMLRYGELVTDPEW